MEKEVLISEINRLRKEKNAVILAHYYQEGDIQDIADFVGDSLALAQNARKTSADIIVFAGVHFMAETAKIINPSKKVLIPDVLAGCSLADSCPAPEFSKFIKNYPDAVVITYINASAEIKALSDIICTSSNAIEVVNSVPKDKRIVFAPDKNLGNYVSGITNRELIIWDGACHVHEEFSLERILGIKENNPDAKILAHPECKKPILLVADHVGSTAALLSFVKKDNAKKYIVATESGILHKMRLENSDKTFIAAPPIDSTCGCNDCKFMKMITLKKIYDSLLTEKPEINLNESLRIKAEKSILRMLEISDNLKNSKN
jgi:quinolinate synthase